jgi:hypothetical protein
MNGFNFCGLTVEAHSIPEVDVCQRPFVGQSIVTKQRGVTITMEALR